MEPSDLLAYLAGHLEKLRLRYLVTGSMATIVYGEPRFTNDIDVVVELSSAGVVDICRGFPDPDYYCSPDAVSLAVQRHFQFNIIHPASGLKIDVMIPDESEFNRSRLARGRRIDIGDERQAWFASPEDVIVKKLVL